MRDRAVAALGTALLQPSHGGDGSHSDTEGHSERSIMICNSSEFVGADSSGALSNSWGRLVFCITALEDIQKALNKDTKKRQKR